MLLKNIAISTEFKRNTSEVIIWRTTSAGYTIFPFSARGGRALMPKRSGEGARFLGGDASPTPAGFVSKGKLNHKFHQKDKKTQKAPSQPHSFFSYFLASSQPTPSDSSRPSAGCQQTIPSHKKAQEVTKIPQPNPILFLRIFAPLRGQPLWILPGRRPDG